MSVHKVGQVGIIGLGKMGSAIARRLTGSGQSVCGWTRRGVDRALAGELGISVAADVAALVAKSDIVILSLFDGDAVTEMLELVCRYDLAGKLIVETSTVSPDLLRGKLGDIKAKGGSAIDAPISGGPDLIAQGGVGIYMGGDEADVARFMPLAELLSDRIVHVGAVGDGAAAKIVNNMMLAGQWQTLKEALQVGKRSGLSLETMMGILTNSPSATPAMKARTPIILGKSERVGFQISGVIKDAELFVATAERLGVEAPAVRAALHSYEEAREAGLGDKDLANMVRKGYLDA